jgi:hypothetical protein
LLVSKTDKSSEVLKSSLKARFQVLTTANMKLGVFWYVALCSQVEVKFYVTTQRYVPEDSKLQLLKAFK